ncbi:hypothetical protein [Kribbella sindirgiensis]|uniref:Uncharacterized protein n=1 Tax=Kribbella sindirgiensis TaxID=1124744 RepID=A0A4R0I009_9ACTN|nr:hypothetical protein [Kribbella sindirgiensis]TCC19880.1 hypothetical protein E0H50_37220 [Kribbella sindirgiensis]
MSSARKVLAAVALGVSALAVAPLTANAQTLHVTHITCHEQEDNTGADDIYLQVDGGTVMESIQFVKGDSKDISGVGIEQGKVLVMREGDFPDEDDNLGQKAITGPGTYEFTDDGAHYTVTVG